MISNCPNCGSNWIGEEIPEKHRYLYSGTHFLRIIGVSSWETDGIIAWQCPDCNMRWDRNDPIFREMFYK